MPSGSDGARPIANKKGQHERRIAIVTGCIRRVWYRTSNFIGSITNKILIDWPFKMICRYTVDVNLLKERTDPTAPLELRDPVNGYKHYTDWLAKNCKHGWWWEEHGGNHNFLVYFRYKEDAMRFKLIWG